MFKGRLFFSKLYWLLGVILYRLIFWSNLKKLHSILRFWFEKFNCIALSPFMKKDHNENYFYIYFLKIKILRAKSCTSQLWPKVNCRLCNWIARNLDHTQKFAKMSNVADWISGSFFCAKKSSRSRPSSVNFSENLHWFCFSFAEIRFQRKLLLLLDSAVYFTIIITLYVYYLHCQWQNIFLSILIL